jgi:hypothetical protein
MPVAKQKISAIAIVYLCMMAIFFAGFVKNQKKPLVIQGPSPEKHSLLAKSVKSLLDVPLGTVKIKKYSKNFLLSFKSGAKQGGRAIGLGHGQGQGKAAGVEQWFRMDWHDPHGNQDWEDKPFHFHIETTGTLD